MQAPKVFTLISISILLLGIGCSDSDTLTPLTEPPDDNDGWEVGSLDLPQSKINYLLEGIDKVKHNEFGEMHSFLIVHNRKLVVEEYFPGVTSYGHHLNFDRFTKHEVQSAGKSFRSAMVGIAIDKGFIGGVDDKVFSFFPEYQDLATPAKDEITLEDMLTMSSGLQWDEGIEDASNNLSIMYGKPYVEWLGYVLGQPLAHEPGSTYVYNTGGSILLNNIIIKSIPTSFQSFLTTYYANLVESTEIPGVGSPQGDLTTPRDMAKLGYVFLYDGKWKDTQVISPAWIEASTQVRFQFDNNRGYGYQWWTRKLQSATKQYDVFYAHGNGGQFIMIIKSLDLVIVSTAGNFGTGGNQAFDLIQSHVLPAFE